MPETTCVLDIFKLDDLRRERSCYVAAVLFGVASHRNGAEDEALVERFRRDPLTVLRFMDDFRRKEFPSRLREWHHKRCQKPREADPLT